jgi:hypothetical protein
MTAPHAQLKSARVQEGEQVTCQIYIWVSKMPVLSTQLLLVEPGWLHIIMVLYITDM